MSIGRYFKFESNVLKVGGWEVGDAKIIFKNSGTERLRLDAGTGGVQLDGDDGLGIVLGNLGGGVDLTTNTALPVFFGTKEDGSRSVFRVGSAGSFLKFDTGTGFEVSSSNFHLDTSGNVSMTGTVTATAGNIGGFTITSGSIAATNFSLNPANKRISLGTGDDIFIADGDEGIQLGDPVFADAPFSVTKAGFLKAESARIGGTAGWQVGSNKLTSNAGNIALDANAGDIIVGTGSDIVRLSGTGDVRISAGHLTPASAPFQVSKEGAITATAGTIGGFGITNNAISSSATFKRGLELKPGEAIRGYGNTAHKTTGAVGKFTFGLGAIAPAAGADVPFNPLTAPAPGNISD